MSELRWTSYVTWPPLEANTAIQYTTLEKSNFYQGYIVNSTNTSIWPNLRASAIFTIGPGSRIELNRQQKVGSYDVDVRRINVRKGYVLDIYDSSNRVVSEIGGREAIGGLDLQSTIKTSVDNSGGIRWRKGWDATKIA